MSASKKPEYKDFQKFLNSYKNKPVSTTTSISSNDSGVTNVTNYSLTSSISNDSFSSFGSDATDFGRNGDIVTSKNNFVSQEEKKTLKSEIFIEVNKSETPVSQVSKIFEVQNGNNHTTDKVIHQNNNNSHYKKNSISEVSKIFESNETYNNKTPLKKTVSHNNSKSFRNFNNNNNTKNKPVFRKLSHPLEDQRAVQKTEIDLEVKPNIHEISKVFQMQSTTTATTQEKNEEIIENKPNVGQLSKILQENFNNNTLKKQQSYEMEDNEIKKNCVSDASKIFQNNATPPSPQKPVVEVKKIIQPTVVNVTPIQPIVPAENDAVVVPEPVMEIPPKAPVPESNGLPPPPPPPLPPANLQQQPKRPSVTQINVQTTNGVNNNTLPKAKVQNGDIPLINSNGEINKNNPLVKKAVYDSLRNMTSSYHEKANEYIATLPKNRVQKDNNNIQNIINNIASQGGLDKLNGRALPGKEKD